MKQTILYCWVLGAVFFVCGNTPSQGQVISLDFIGASPSTALLATDVAGAVPVGNWNSVSGTNGSNLLDDLGAATTLDFNWTGGGTWRATATAQTDPTSNMLNGIRETTNGNLVISQIPYAAYSIYVYFSEQAARNGTLTLSGGTTYYIQTSTNVSALDLVTSTTAGVYEQGNYVIFSGLAGASQTINLSMAPAGANMGIAGFQVVAVPEPSTYALLLGGMLFLFCARRAARASA